MSNSSWSGSVRSGGGELEVHTSETGSGSSTAEQGVDNIDIGESQVKDRDGDNEFAGRVSRDDISRSGSVIQIQDSCDNVDSDHSEGV